MSKLINRMATPLLAAGLVILSAWPVSAWTPVGPWGGAIHDIVNAPAGGDTLYAATANGIYAYAGTLPWEPLPETTGIRFVRMAPDPDHGYLYAIGKPGDEAFSPESPINTGSLYRLDLADGTVDLLPTPKSVHDVAICGDGVVLAAANGQGTTGTGILYRFPMGSFTPKTVYPGKFNSTYWPLYSVDSLAGSSTVYLVRNSTTMADVLISQNSSACGDSGTWARDPVAGYQIWYQNNLTNPTLPNNLAGGMFVTLGRDPSNLPLLGSSNGRVFTRASGAWLAMGTITPNYCIASFGSDLSGRTYAALRKYNWDTSNGDEQHGGLFYYSAGSWLRDPRLDVVTSRIQRILPYGGQDWVAFDDAGIRRLPSGGAGPGEEADLGIAAVDLSGVALGPRDDHAVAFGSAGLYERRDGAWRRVLLGSVTDNQGLPLQNDPLQVARERGFLCAALSPSDSGVIWIGGYTTGLFRGERSFPESWDYDWKRVYWDTLGAGNIHDVLVDPFDSRTIWWATGGRGAFLSRDEGITASVLTDPFQVESLTHNLLEPSQRTVLAGIIASPISQYLPALLTGNGIMDFQYTNLYKGGNVESLQFHPLALGDSSRALVGQQGSWDREMALIQDGSGSWIYDSSVGDPTGLPGAPHFPSLRMPLGYDADEHPDAFTAVHTEGTVIQRGLYYSVADTAFGSPGRVWQNMDPDDALTSLGPTSVAVHPRDGNLLWVTTHRGSAYTLAGSHVTDVVPPSFPLGSGLEILEVRPGDAIDLYWLAPGDDGDLPGWATRYQIYYRTDYPIAGTSGLAGAYSVALPAPQIAHQAESYSLDISSHAGSDFFSIALRAFDEEGNASNLLVADVSIGAAASNHAPVAADDPVTLAEDNAAVVAVTTNDTDADYDPLTVIRVTAASHGWSWIDQAGQVNYEPLPDYFGTDGFGYTVVDGHGGSDSARVSLTVSAVNDPPVAVDDSAATNEDVVPYKSILPVQNDSDVDNQVSTLVVTISSPPSYASSFTVAGQEIRYVPMPNFFGTDTLVYKVKDAAGGSDTATVTITVNPVNDPPVANDDTAVTDEDVPVDIAVLANDTDVEGDTLAVYSIASQPSHGTAATVSSTLIRYSPSSNWFGTDTFVYTARDGNGGSDIAVVTVTVNQVNNPPTVTGESLYAFSNTTRIMNLLANDVDPDGDPISIGSITQPSHGSAAVIDSAAGTVSYAPAADYLGTDAFTYTVVDNQALSTQGTVSLTVVLDEGRPYAQEDMAATLEDISKVIQVLDNDLDALRIDTVSSAGNGQALIGSGQVYLVYTPASDYFGTDVFTYTVANSVGGTDSATVTITVTPVNDDPVAVDDLATAVAGPVSVDVLDNDSDPADGDTVTLDAIQIPAAHGSAVAQPDDTILYTPMASYAGTDTFTYRISDGKGGMGAATVTVVVLNTPVNPQGPVQFFDPVADAPSPVRVVFDSGVSQAGKSTALASMIGPSPPSGFRSGSPARFFDLGSTAVFGTPLTVCVDYSGVAFADESTLEIFRFDDSSSRWVNLTANLDTARDEICGLSTSLSTFAVFEAQASSGGGGGGGGGGCFIATAAYGSPMAGEVRLLKAYRDGYLANRGWGRVLVKVYYAVSPVPAAFIAGHPWLRAAARSFLYPVILAARSSVCSAYPALLGLMILLLPAGVVIFGVGVLGRKIRHAPGRARIM